jgi:hypothetical protein
MQNKKYLEDPEFLFTILAALVKKNDGEINITESEMDKVSKKDIIGMYYNKKDKTFCFKSVDPTTLLSTPLSSGEQFDN